MSQVGFTPIQIYRSATAATLPVAGNLAPGELAINTTDEKLYFENTGGTVTLLASSAAAGGTFTTVTATTVVNGLGAVGTPSYTFTGDLNTGMWSPGSDTVAVSTAGLERMRISSAGLVGIGTNAATSTLSVVSAVATDAAQFSDATNYTLAVRSGGAATALITGTVGAALAIGTNNTEKMRIDSAGNVGIGTTAPAVKLDVSGGGIRGQALDATGSPALFTSTGGGVLYHNGGGAVVLRAYANASGTAGELTFNTNANERMRIDTGGNVGVGTSAPTSRLTVASGQFTSPALNIIGAGPNQGWLRLGNNADIKGGDDLLGLTFTVGASERMRIDSSGNVGIGTSSPFVKLQVVGGSILSDTSVQVLKDGSDSIAGGPFFLLRNAANTQSWITQLGASNTYDFWNFDTSWQRRVTFTAAGNVGVGTTAPTTGSMSNLATVNAGIFITHRGAISAATGTPVTIAVAAGANNVTYIVSCTLAASDPVNYSAVAIVSGDAGVFRVTMLQAATLMFIGVSGTNIQAQQNSGATQTIQFCITRVS